jgi:branched-chain amino acid transport system permease protein
MNLQIVALLGQDGVTNGAIYALLSLSILLVFTVTRVLLIPQGEFVSFGALAMAAMQAGKPASLGWLLLALSLTSMLAQCWNTWRAARMAQRRWQPPWRSALMPIYALALMGLLAVLPLQALPMGVQALLTLALVTPLGPLMYRVFFQPIAGAHALVLLIVSIAVHVSLVGIGLLMFGAEGSRTAPFSEAGLDLGLVKINSQTLWVIAVSLLLILGLYLLFERTLYGKALRATAVHQLGARLMGISPSLAGQASFGLAAFIGGLSGILIAPLTTLYFDSGFIISLKGFVGAIIGGMASYPVAALGALAVGLIESFSTFWASSFKEVIVFTLILPFLLWRSLAARHSEEDEQ